MKYILSFYVLFFVVGAFAQTDKDLKAYYSFDDCTANELTGNGPNGTILGNPACVCGAAGDALNLNGTTDHILFIGILNDYFEKENFTLSFFFSPSGASGTQTIFSKKEDCDDLNAFAVRYTPQSQVLTVELSENSSKRSILNTKIDAGKCWQHVTIVRSAATTKLYLNGTLRESHTVISRIDLTNNASLGIAEGPCVGLTDNRFKGVIDELRIYDRDLDEDEVLGLYEPIQPDNIITSDTTVFIGNDVQIVTGSTCADVFTWTPDIEMDDATIPEPLISPTVSRVYTLSFRDNFLGCTAEDSIRIIVLDPDELDCTKVFLPKAFTPNNDGLNDTYGISNPYAINDLISFEIFDRWGGKVFYTTNPMDHWDGTSKGQPLNPGVLLYKVRYRCKGEELIDAGSLTILK
jgi:gliding motility-associated-like protein